MARRLKIPVEWSRDALQDLQNARTWYSEQAPHVTSRFREAVRNSVRRISENPRLYPAVHPGVRRVVLHRFPYSIYYQLEGNRVLIIAALHQARDPGVWRGRI